WDPPDPVGRVGGESRGYPLPRVTNGEQVEDRRVRCGEPRECLGDLEAQGQTSTQTAGLGKGVKKRW
ncbi:hypothetical protein NEUTE1DRAFT_96826, partial [Neurospora tetrasperma FGSC 2508]